MPELIRSRINKVGGKAGSGKGLAKSLNSVRTVSSMENPFVASSRSSRERFDIPADPAIESAQEPCQPEAGKS